LLGPHVGDKLHTRNDCQFTPEVSQANFGYVEAIDNDPSRGGFNKAEERQSQGTLSRTCTTQNANLRRWLVQDALLVNDTDLLPGLNGEIQVMQYIREVRLREGVRQKQTWEYYSNVLHISLRGFRTLSLPWMAMMLAGGAPRTRVALFEAQSIL
jgi:hypothetical protein